MDQNPALKLLFFERDLPDNEKMRKLISQHYQKICNSKHGYIPEVKVQKYVQDQFRNPRPRSIDAYNTEVDTALFGMREMAFRLRNGKEIDKKCSTSVFSTDPKMKMASIERVQELNPFSNTIKVNITNKVQRGTFILSSPFPQTSKIFSVSVMLITEHNSQGTKGLVINKTRGYGLGFVGGSQECISYLSDVQEAGSQKVMDGVFYNEVETSSGYSLKDNYMEWAMRAKLYKTQVKNKDLHSEREQETLRNLTQENGAQCLRAGKFLKPFYGITSWGSGRLQEEIKAGTWFPVEISDNSSSFNASGSQTPSSTPFPIIFSDEVDSRYSWNFLMGLLGGEYKFFSDFPNYRLIW
eukprot:TRINITY_DN3294_c0_g1_i1.p1 TRINITY_DN3294_c0_g1~~TRINITY_DN3294_c0_g1_i1.p1  ORF type:complete len:391 (-),score=68.73 TRINITY_DN3294_c0_g1_i1:82-1143(-)